MSRPLFSIDEAKSYFLDRPTLDSLHNDAKRGLIKFGAMTRRAAKRSLRKARQKKISELSKEERRIWRIRVSMAKKKGDPRPKRPLAPSAPGEPPRMRQGHIKRLMFFGYEPESRSVVTGPAKLEGSKGAPRTLEEGGPVSTKNGSVRIAQRPYMRPAFNQHIDKLPRLLTGQA